MTPSISHALKKPLLASTLAISILLSGGSFDQAQQVTGPADPSRAADRIIEESLIPQGGPNIRIKKLSLQKAPAGADKIMFNFAGLQMSGVGVYNEDDLSGIYQNQIGNEISLADLYAIANQITSKYRRDGYVLTQVIVPPQTIDNGIAQLQVVEGFIDNITVEGGEENPTALKVIKDYARQISSNGQPLNINEMERQLLLINDLPGVMARSIISPSQSTRGAADMLISLERDTFEAFVGVNNHGSRFLGPVQFNAGTTFNSLFGQNERITTQIAFAPDQGLELAFGSLDYEQPVGRYGTKLNFGGSIASTDPGFTLRPIGVDGLSENLYIGVEHPFIRSRNTNVFGRTTFNFRNVENRVDGVPTIEDRIRVIRAGIRADFLDRLLGTAVNSIDFELSHGLDIFGATDSGDANITRAAGDPTFFKGNLRFERLQRLSSNFNLVLSGRAQLSNNPLLSSEEFGLGGYTSVRGFEPSEVVGDDGIGGTAELQWNNPERNVQLFGFLDTGTVWDQDASAISGNRRNSLTSTGIGVRFDLPYEVNAEFVAAQPLHRDISSRNSREPQFFFSLTKSF